MGATTAAPRDRCPLLFLLLLLLLFLLPSPAQGNEGGAAGSCQCERRSTAPRFPERLESCDTCKDFTRFNFPKRRVCGLHGEPWVTEFKNTYCRKGRPEEGAGRADASRGDRVPAPTSPTTAPSATSPTSPMAAPTATSPTSPTTAPTATSPTSPMAAPTATSPTSPTTAPSATSPSLVGVCPGESQEMPWATESHKEVTWVPAMAESTPEPTAEADAEEVNNAPLGEKEAAPLSAHDAKTPSITVLCVLIAGFAVLMYCWRRRRSRRQGGQRPQTPLREEEEGRLCLPGENT